MKNREGEVSIENVAYRVAELSFGKIGQERFVARYLEMLADGDERYAQVLAAMRQVLEAKNIAVPKLEKQVILVKN